VSGLETSLYTFLLLLCLVLAPASSDSWLGVVSGLLVLCRPDGAIAAALAVGVRWRQSGRRAAMRTVAVAGIVVLPWLIFSTAYFGSFVPQSVLAKATLSRPPLIGWRTLLSFFWEGKYVGLTVLALAGWAVLGLGRRHVALWLVGAWTAFYAVLFAATGAFSDFPWYFVPMLPAYFAGMATAVTWLADAGSGMLGRLAPARPVSRLVTLAGAVVCAAAIVVGLLNVRHHREFLERLSRGREAAYTRVAVQLSHEDGKSVLAATEIGTLGYFYRGPVVDLVGLVSPEAVGRPPLDVLTETHARWLVTYDTHFPRDVASSGAFLRQYERVGHTAVGAGRSLDVYRSRTAPVTPAITR
jgi:hypothetical protein